MVKPLVFTWHARDALEERSIIQSQWVESCVREPDWVVADDARDGRERRFKVIKQFGDRILRVVCLENDTEIRIITVFFDRKAQKP